MAKHNEVGAMGETVSKEFLISKGHVLVMSNYRKKYGEIDIISKKGHVTHFVEVKTVSYETATNVKMAEHFRPEENVHPGKIQRLLRVISAYILEKNVGEWQFDVIAVYLDEKTKTARVKFLENIVLGS